MCYLKNVLFLSYPKLFLTQTLFAKLLLCYEILGYFQTHTHKPYICILKVMQEISSILYLVSINIPKCCFSIRERQKF